MREARVRSSTAFILHVELPQKSSPAAIILRRPVKQMPIFVKPGSMAGTVVSLLFRIPPKPAAHVRAIRHDPALLRRQKVLHKPLYRIQALNAQFFHRLARKPSLWRKDTCHRTSLLRDQGRQDLSRSHRRSHPPLSESSRHIPIRLSGRKTSDIWNTVQRHAILRRPLPDHPAFGIKCLRLIPQPGILSAFLIPSGSMTASPKQQRFSLLPKRQPIPVDS